MENKNRYYNLLKEDNGQHNEIDLGEKIGLNVSARRTTGQLIL